MPEPREIELPPQRNQAGTTDSAVSDLMIIAGDVVSDAMNGDTPEGLIESCDGAADAASEAASGLLTSAAEAVGTVAEAVIDAICDS